MVTRDDVARRAKTSAAVVSYVVNDGPRPVSAQTRARVVQAIEDLGYRPNRLARALRTSSTNVLGAVLPDIANPFFSELARAIEDASLDAGYALFLGSSEQNVDRQNTYLRAFAEHQVEGLLVIAASDEEHASLRAHQSLLPQARVPLVLVDRLPEKLEALSVTVDNEQGGYLATRHLLEHGHRYVHCLSGPRTLSSVRDRIDGWRRAMHATRRGGTERQIVSSDFNRIAASEAATRLLSSESRPTAIFVHSDEQAIGVLNACRRLELSVPGDVAIVSFDGTREAMSSWPTLTTMVQPIRDIGRCAVETLVLRLNAERQPGAKGRRVRSTVLPVTLAIGETCGCAAREIA